MDELPYYRDKFGSGEKTYGSGKERTLPLRQWE
jgi:hypothetical protein